jgi:hypothetical protein
MKKIYHYEVYTGDGYLAHSCESLFEANKYIEDHEHHNRYGFIIKSVGSDDDDHIVVLDQSGSMNNEYPWYELFTGGEAHGWICEVDDHMGIISWRSDKPEHAGIEILATPNWEDSGNTGVAYTNFDGEYHTLDTIPLFNSFEEYVEAMKPYLEHYKVMIESCQVLYEE